MTDTAAVIDQFNASFLERAPEKLVDLIAADCVMEGTGPAPDGNVWTGYDECLAGWQALASDPTIQFEVEHVDVDRADHPLAVTGAQHYRGVNLMRLQGRQDRRGPGVRQAALAQCRQQAARHSGLMTMCLTSAMYRPAAADARSGCCRVRGASI